MFEGYRGPQDRNSPQRACDKSRHLNHFGAGLAVFCWNRLLPRTSVRRVTGFLGFIAHCRQGSLRLGFRPGEVDAVKPATRQDHPSVFFPACKRVTKHIITSPLADKSCSSVRTRLRDNPSALATSASSFSPCTVKYLRILSTARLIYAYRLYGYWPEHCLSWYCGTIKLPSRLVQPSITQAAWAQRCC